MGLSAQRLHAAIIGLAIVVAPLILWLALYLLTKTSSAELRGVLGWIRALRWIGWSCGLAVILFALFRGTFISYYGMVLVAFSSGLALPEGWLKKRFNQAA